MKEDRWQRVKDIYNSVLELPPEKREDYLREACAGNQELRGEVERLLARNPEAERFIESPALEVAARDLARGGSGEEGPPLAGRLLQSGSVGGDTHIASGRGGKRRPSWWVCLCLLACTTYILADWYVLFTGPETPGFIVRPAPEGRVITLVQPGYAADRAGLRVGDILVSVNGLTGRDAILDIDRVAVGKTWEVVVQRQGKRVTATLAVGRKGKAYWGDPVEGLGHLADMPIAALSLCLAWLIAFRGPDVATARMGALLLALWPVRTMVFFRAAVPGFFQFLGQLPVPLLAFPAAAMVMINVVLDPLALTFFASFPRKRIRGRWIWFVAWLPAVGFALPLAAIRLYYWLYQPPIPIPYLMAMLQARRALMLAYFCAILPVLIWNYRGLEDVNERRRLRVMVAGVAIALGAGMPELLLQTSSSVAARDLLYAYYLSPLLYLLAVLLSALGPASIGYTVLKHRVFDVRIIIRQGLQYAAARRILLALAPFFGAILVADLALHSNQTMAQAFAQRGWLYAVLGILALVAHSKRKAWLSSLDRRFFREHYDAQRILRTVLSDVREADSLEQAAEHAVSQIDAGLHPEFVALLLRRPKESSFRVIASAGKQPDSLELFSDSKLMGLVRLLGKPMEVQQSETGWLRRQLPQDESAWLTGTRIEWIFPVAAGEGSVEVLLALGPKKSEEPYTQEDQDLIEGITSGLALLVERVTSRTAKGSERPLGAVIELPQVPSRYSIRRELGRGGMGTVYEAHDTELERGVAVKVMRPELLSSEEAVARFRREARAAAGFSHPNVVTVYDFGVAGDGGAYLIMELLAGRTLRRLLREEGRLAPARAAHILRGVCSAVEAAHQRPLLHRDLKPENIFLVRADGGEVPKVLDFGVAKPLETTESTLTLADTSPGQLLGTLAYMSPEQLRGEPPAPGWDLWALAVIAYEMVTGAHPFLGPGVAVNEAVLAGRLTPARAHLGTDGEMWEGFFANALAAELHRRPATAGELFQRFEALPAGTAMPHIPPR